MLPRERKTTSVKYVERQTAVGPNHDRPARRIQFVTRSHPRQPVVNHHYEFEAWRRLQRHRLKQRALAVSGRCRTKHVDRLRPMETSAPYQIVLIAVRDPVLIIQISAGRRPSRPHVCDVYGVIHFVPEIRVIDPGTNPRRGTVKKCY